METMWVEHSGNVAVVHLAGEYSSADAPTLGQLQQLFLSLAAEPPPCRILLDFSSTSYFGAGFLGIVLEASQAVKHRQGRFACCHVAPHLREMISVTGLHSMWERYPTREQALSVLTADLPHEATR
jgi:anti-anti-sigma factor